MIRTLTGWLPLVALALTAGATWVSTQEPQYPALVVVLGVVTLLAVRLSAPDTYRLLMHPFRRYRRSTRVLRRWRRSMLALDMDKRDEDALNSRPPRLTRVRTDALLNTQGTVKLSGVHSIADIQKQTDRLQTAFNAAEVRLMATSHPRRFTLQVIVTNLLTLDLPEDRWLTWINKGHDLDRLPIGQNETNQQLTLDLTSEHVLIGGATGSGKSTLLAAIIGAIITSRPVRPTLVLCDPKRVELAAWRPAASITATDMEDIAQAIYDVRDVMEARYDRMEQNGVRGTIPAQLLNDLDGPIFLIIEELSSLVSHGDKEALKALDEISRKGRAAGIHLICALQSPKAENFKGTGSLRDQLGCQIAAHVARTSDSDVILGQGTSTDPNNPLDASEITLPGEVIIRNAAHTQRGRSPLLTDATVEHIAQHNPARDTWATILDRHHLTPAPDDETSDTPTPDPIQEKQPAS